MSVKPLHLNLLKPEEYRTPYPVRIRIVGPLLAAMLVLGVALWWGLQQYRLMTMQQNAAQLSEMLEGMKPTHRKVLERRGELRGLQGLQAQLGLYRGAQLDFGRVFEGLPGSVPSSIQLTELRIPAPAAPLSDAKRPELGVTNKVESVALRLTGRTEGAGGATKAVDALVAALQQPEYGGVLRRVEVPKGGFRQDMSIRNQTALIFEIVCECQPRRFGE